ncbi:MAG TPA: CPBP family intramembrane glutamic endopeptidase, partial [Armatimonadota bacterium]
SPIPVPITSTVIWLSALLCVALLYAWRVRLTAAQAGWRVGGFRVIMHGLGWGALLGLGGVAWLRLLIRTGNYLPIPIIPTQQDWLLLVALAPLVEEIALRGVVLGSLLRNWHPVWAFILSAIVSMCCLPMEQWVAFVFVSSLGYAQSFRKSGSVVAPMIAHALVASVLILARLHPAAVGALSSLVLWQGCGIAIALITLSTPPPWHEHLS